jgi:hypothetical protein
MAPRHGEDPPVSVRRFAVGASAVWCRLAVSMKTPRPNRLHPMTESEEAFVRRAVRRKRLFLKLSVASLIVAAALVVLYLIFWWRDHSYPVGPRAVIILLILLNARQNLRQYRYAGVLEQLLPPEATPR